MHEELSGAGVKDELINEATQLAQNAATPNKSVKEKLKDAEQAATDMNISEETAENAAAASVAAAEVLAEMAYETAAAVAAVEHIQESINPVVEEAQAAAETLGVKHKDTEAVAEAVMEALAPGVEMKDAFDDARDAISATGALPDAATVGALEIVYEETLTQEFHTEMTERVTDAVAEIVGQSTAATIADVVTTEVDPFHEVPDGKVKAKAQIDNEIKEIRERQDLSSTKARQQVIGAAAAAVAEEAIQQSATVAEVTTQVVEYLELVDVTEEEKDAVVASTQVLVEEKDSEPEELFQKLKDSLEEAGETRSQAAVHVAVIIATKEVVDHARRTSQPRRRPPTSSSSSSRAPRRRRSPSWSRSATNTSRTRSCTMTRSRRPSGASRTA